MSVAQRHSFSLARTDLPTVPLTSAVPVFTVPLEDDALGHWMLGGDASCLYDAFHGTSLTLQGASPAYDANSVSLTATSTGPGNALLSPKSDGLQQTFACVVRRPASAVGSIFAGALLNSPVQGSSLHQSTATPAILRTVAAGQTLSQPYPAGVGVDDAMFVALSEDGANRTFTQLIGGSAPITTIVPTTRTPYAAGKLSLGNAYYASASFANAVLRASEFIVWDHYKSPSELLDVYARSVNRCAARGVVVK